MSELRARLDQLAGAKDQQSLGFLTHPLRGQRRVLVSQFLEGFGAPPPVECWGADVTATAAGGEAPHSPVPEPGALDAAGLRHVVAVLSTVQIVSWGVLYYAFAALQSSITRDTGWSAVAVTGAFSTAQLVSGGVGLWVGRHLDAYGPRTVMTAASLTAVPGLAAVALAPNIVVFYVGWVLTGSDCTGQPSTVVSPKIAESPSLP